MEFLAVFFLHVVVQKLVVSLVYHLNVLLGIFFNLDFGERRLLQKRRRKAMCILAHEFLIRISISLGLFDLDPPLGVEAEIVPSYALA